MSGMKIKPFVIWDNSEEKKRIADALDKVGEKIKDFFSDKDETDYNTSIKHIKSKEEIEQMYPKKKGTRDPEVIRGNIDNMRYILQHGGKPVDSIPKGMESEGDNLRADVGDLQKEASRGVLDALSDGVKPVDIASNLSQDLFNEANERNQAEQESRVKGLSV